jgi:hypothetical protein
VRYVYQKSFVRVLDLWKQWTTIRNKYDLHVELEDRNGKMNGDSRSSKAAVLRKGLTESLRWTGSEGQGLRGNSQEFYKEDKKAAIKQ